MPVTVAAAWGVRDEPRKGPRPSLTLNRIVTAAMSVADTDGIAAVSMARVAAAAGTAPMSLYRHVAGKEELLDLMWDAAWGAPPDGPHRGEGWREALSRWAWGMREAAHRRPWMVRLPVRGLPILPNQVAWFEFALACLAGTRLTEARKASVILLVSGYVRNVAGTEADIASAVLHSGQDADDWMASYARWLGQVTDPLRFPAVTALLQAGVFDVSDEPDDEFIFGLDRILDGIAALIGPTD